jgi:hypothetical protein
MTTNPKTRKAPANAGLPSLDRRSLVRGLGTAAFIGVPVTAGAALVSDPVFQALAALEQLKIHAGESEAAHSVAEDAVSASRKENAVIIDGEEMRTHAQIDTHFKPAFGLDDEEQFKALVKRLRPRHLPDAERAERDLARQAAHDELTRQEAAVVEVEQRVGFREIEAQQESANRDFWAAEYKVMEANPATPAGAVALLRFVAGLMEYLGDDGERGHYALAIRNAADFFEGSASA